MNNFINYLFFLSIILLTNCEKPSADFEFENAIVNTHCVAPCDVNFTSLSLEAENYLWDFGDNETSTYINPQHRFSEPGTYTVTLTAFGKGKKESTISKDVVIHDTPQKMTFKGVTLKKIPLTDFQGNNWDDAAEGNFPDVFIELNNAGSVIYFTNESQVINDVDANKLPIHWDFTQPYEISSSDFYRVYYFDVEDKDDPVNSIITYKSFRFSDYIFAPNRFPYNFTILTDDLEAEFELDWE